MGKYLNFEVESADVIEEDVNSQFCDVRIQAFSSGENRHDLYCSEETLRKTAPTLYDKPILYTIDRVFGDFASHNDPDKSLIAGFVVPDSAKFIKLPDGRTSLVVLAKLWKKYAPKVIEFFKRDDGQKKVSVEMELYESAPINSLLTEMKDFAYFGVCLLGDLITEASPGANAQIISFAKENEEYQKALQIEFSSKYSDLDMTFPESIKANANKALSIHKELGRGINNGVLAIGRFISANTHATPEKIKSMAKMLKRYAKRDLSDEKLDDYICYLALGGEEGFLWASELSDEIDKIDAQKIAYFGESKENGAENDVQQDNNEKKEVKTFMEDEKDEKGKVEEPEKKEEEMAAPESEKKEDEKPENQENMEAEKPEEKEEKEDKEEEETPEDEKKEEMASETVFTVETLLAMLEEEKQKYAAKDAECMAFAAENKELKKFKADIEEQKFNFEIASTMSEVKDIMPQAEYDALQEKAKEFSLENIDAFKNLARAKAFEFSKGKKKEEDGILKYSLPWGDKKENKSSLWD